MRRIFFTVLTLAAIGFHVTLVAAINELLLHHPDPGQALQLLLVLVFGWGILAAFLSVVFAFPLAISSVRGRIVSTPRNDLEALLLEALADLAGKAGIAVPRLLIYPAEPNAFSIGSSRNRAMVGLSQGLIETLGRRELQAVMAHEVAHIANGDMLTLGIVQGFLNGFVVWPALLVDRVLAFLFSHWQRRRGPGLGYWLVFLTLFFAVFGPLAGLIGAAFSRSREYRADKAVARITGRREHLTSALNRLATLRLSAVPGPLACHYFVGPRRSIPLFSTHPDFMARIKALKGE